MTLSERNFYNVEIRAQDSSFSTGQITIFAMLVALGAVLAFRAFLDGTTLEFSFGSDDNAEPIDNNDRNNENQKYCAGCWHMCALGDGCKCWIDQANGAGRCVTCEGCP